MERVFQPKAKTWKLIAFAAVLAASAIVLWRYVAPVIRLVAGGTVFAFLFDQLCEKLAVHVKRSAAAALAILLVIGSLGGVLFLLAPYMAQQGEILLSAIPGSVSVIRNTLNTVLTYLEDKGISIGLQAMQIDWNAFSQFLNTILSNAIGFFSGIASGISSVILMLVMAYFFLSDKERLLLRLEMLVPLKSRKLAIRMAGAVKRELILYLRGQLMICLTIGIISAIALVFVGIPSALLLGVLIGILDLIPYFGPILGGIPAVILAFDGGIAKVLLTIAVLIAVQQFDNVYISPRIMGDLTGISPVAVLLALTLGNSIAGIVGMLFALPILLILRISLRVWAQRHETN